MGLRASDCAAVQGRDSTAEFLLMFETSLGITRELLARERQQDQVSRAVSVYSRVLLYLLNCAGGV